MIVNRHRYHYRPPNKRHSVLLGARRMTALPPSSLPARVDLRSFCLPVRDQGQEGCCSGFSTAALREILANQASAGSAVQLSPAYLYGRTRIAEGTFPRDVGATISDEFATLENYGVCPETALPYTGDAALAPTPTSDVAATPFRVRQIYSVGNDLNAVLSALAANRPVVFGMPVFPSFEDTGTNGIVTPPKPGETCLGGHALDGVGYDLPNSIIIGRNSWSDGWGDGGYFYLPFSMVSHWFEAFTASLEP